MKLVLLNTTIATTNGTFKITDLSLEKAEEMGYSLKLMEKLDN